MNLLTVLVTFGIILVAELPDKTMFASLVLGTRFSPRWVFAGVAAAFAVHVVLAVSAGQLLTLLPHRVLDLVVAALFLLGAGLMLHASRSQEQGEHDAERSGKAPRSAWGVAGTSFLVVFLGEWGDITQIATANLAARYRDAWSVGLGAVLGLWAAALLAILAGRTLLKFVSVSLLHRIGAVIFLGFAIWSVVEAFG